MDDENIFFEQFLVDRMKHKNISLKKLVDLTGIAPSHIESLMRGEFEDLPSAPYFRGYLMRLGKALDFDGEEWWLRLKREGSVKNLGDMDALPKNRFVKQSPPKYLWFIIAGVLVLTYFLFQAPRIFGRPSLTLTFPNQTSFTTASSTLTIKGTVQNADSVALNGDPIPVSADGTWQKEVSLGNGLNTFQITAKKFLGGEATVVEQVIYQAPAGASNSSSTTTSTASTTPLAPQVHFQHDLPATGTFFE